MRITGIFLLSLCLAAPALAQEAPAPGAEREIGGVVFVWCPPGEFLCGASMDSLALAEAFGGEPEWYEDELPQQQIEIAHGFWLSRQEITRAQWVAVSNSRPWGDEPNQDMELPAAQLTWEEAAAFARDFSQRNACSARLPQETEWEYACRAGTTDPYYFGPTPDALEQNAQYRVNAAGRVQHGGQRGANPWGLQDVLGNVWEWCQDKYAPKINAEPIPVGAAVRVIRGGAANSTAAFLRSSYRTGLPIDTRSPRVGLRLLVEP